jgi:hypothetical protein
MAESAKIKLMFAKIGILSKPNLSEKACILAKLLSETVVPIDRCCEELPSE